MSLAHAYIEDNNLNHTGCTKLLAAQPTGDVAQAILDHGMCDGEAHAELRAACMHIMRLARVIEDLEL